MAEDDLLFSWRRSRCHPSEPNVQKTLNNNTNMERPLCEDDKAMHVNRVFLKTKAFYYRNSQHPSIESSLPETAALEAMLRQMKVWTLKCCRRY